MTVYDLPQPEPVIDIPEDRLLKNMKDYTAMSFELLWQRQAIFLAVTVLTAFFFDPFQALVFYITILLCEVQDLMLARRVAGLRSHERQAVTVNLIWILLNTVLSSGAICIYAVSVAFQQPAGAYFTPLFFLFAAALFAAMNNHQLVWALALRLAMYAVSFMLIVVKDLWTEWPDPSPDLWLHFFTVVFVMYFLIDCSFVFLKLYKTNLAQLEKLREEHERTKAAYIAKSQFVSTVSHELRTPLTSIKGSIDLINSGALGEVPERMEGLLDMAGKNSKRLSSLINDLLDLQKIEAGELVNRRETIEVGELVREAVGSNLGYATAHNVEIGTDAEAEQEPVFVMGDSSRLMQVLANMISNAVKFSFDSGQVIVGHQQQGDRVRIYVRDNGIGIPEGSKETVFDRFTQVDSSDERHAGGTGLGMNISKEIIESLGGLIDYTSRVGSGTEFYIELPVLDTSEQRESGAA